MRAGEGGGGGGSGEGEKREPHQGERRKRKRGRTHRKEGGKEGQGGLQSSEVIIDRGHGIGFFLGNVDKYNGRYGKKGDPTDHRKDLMKIIHYGFLALFEHDRKNNF